MMHEHWRKSGKFDCVYLQVKSGHIGAKDVRDLRGTMERENAAIGVLISLEKPTRPMEVEAASAVRYELKMWGQKYPRLHLLTVKELFAGKKIEMLPIPQWGATFKKTGRHRKRSGEQLSFKDPNSN